MDIENETKIIKMYAPLEPCKHHVSSSKIHSNYGKHKESIVSKKISITLKIIGTILLAYLYFKYAMPKIEINSETERLSSYIMPVFFIGFTLYQILHLFYRVDLFETGMVYKNLFTSKNYSYDELYDIKFSYDENFYLDEKRHGILWFIFAKRFYRYYGVSFTSGKGFRLRPRTFRNLDVKITDLQRNLIDLKIEK